MDVSPILDPLNDAQRAAVSAEPTNLLVLAGAGSGKTRVLVHRVAWYIATAQASPQGILAVTFTNKAAAEMRGRIEQLLAMPASGMWVGTFHGIAHRLLRAHSREAGLPENFQILDSDDQLRTIRRVIKGMGLDDSRWPAREAQWFINARKEEGLRAGKIPDHGDETLAQLARIYRVYEETCERTGVVDFTELLLRSLELWRDSEGLLQHYRQRFRHVLVDEFQDTNSIQYAWLRYLGGSLGRPADVNHSLFVVGDDDQSIYSWRGAQVEHMERFSRDFPNVRLVRLEQNYRSTGTILKAANALIRHNAGRLGKELWTEQTGGEPVRLYSAFNDREEARYCVDQIAQWHARGRQLREAAILYRTSAQSRLFEDALRDQRLPYRVYGGFRFYERAEVKDALAYLRLAASREDDAAFERVINTPMRGIGDRTMDAVRAAARSEAIPLWRAAQRLMATRELPSRALGALGEFMRLIDSAAYETAALPLGEAMDVVIRRSRLPEHYRKEKDGRGEERIENLDELITAAREFEIGDPEFEGMTPVQAFLARAALESGEGQAEAHEDCVQLMTLHSAKGLEFPLVFMVGMEEGLFPHQRSSEEPAQLEEERRLCYVGITRARERLVMTHAESRRLHGTDLYPRPSRFISELPAELVSEVRMGGSIGVPRYDGRRGTEEDRGALLRLGQRVRHASFGDGVVLNVEGQGAHMVVQVNFEASGTKRLLAAQANLVSV
ncbi:MAG: DNA helicase II [Gammaproteobacteria bacterium]|nr:DNA helicase II [Gammaproteobacteria bacterium]